MRTPVYVMILFVLLVSCSGINRIVEINDPYKNLKSIRLSQQPDAFSDSKKGPLGGRALYGLTTNLISESQKGEKPRVKICFDLITGIRTDEFDSVMYFDLDQEKIKLVSGKYNYRQFDRSSTSSTSSTITSVEKKPDGKTDLSAKAAENVKTENTQTTTVEDGNYQLMTREFMVPENLWIPIANTREIGYRLYIGYEGIDVELSQSEMTKVRDFFNQVIQLRDAVSPSIPEGQKKW